MRKQKVSALATMMLVLLAFSVYLILPPAPAQALTNSCEGVYAPCATGGGTGCQSGTGYCAPSGSHYSAFVYCSDEMGNVPGPGSCLNGCVKCDYGR